MVGSDPQRVREEVRLALVLNGGVSLAVWIGGVTHEIDRLRRAGHDDDVGDWGTLVDALNLNVNVDVVAGASAGGLNGAVLAASIARSRKLPQLRKTWLEVADVSNGPPDLTAPPGHERLLTRNHDWSTPSVLDGDFFLHRIHAVFADAETGASSAPTDVALYLTGTSLNGKAETYDDESGAQFSQREYRVRFRFRRQSGLVTAEGGPDADANDFVSAASDADLADLRLARAARATASFPGAFVPVFCHVGGEGAPDMGACSNLTSSRWVMDGGVLDNQPFGPVFDEIRRRPLDSPVDRVLAYVVPYGGGSDHPTADAETDVPGPISVVPKAFNLPREVGIVDDLAQLRELLLSVTVDQSAQRELRESALSAPDSIKTLTEMMLEPYRRRRLYGGVWQAREVLANTPDEGTVSLVPLPPWTASGSDAEWVPKLIAVDPTGSWSWGVSVAESFVRTWLSVVRDALEATRTPSLGEAVDTISRQLLRLDAITKRFESELRKALAPSSAASDDVVLAAARSAFATATGGADPRAPWLRQIVDATVSAVIGVGSEPGAGGSPVVPEGATTDALILAHLQGEVVLQAFQPPSLSPAVPRFRFHRVSPDPTSPLDAEANPRHHTIMGLALNHFGGFLKREWRANDWMWGRLHGTHHLVRMLLNPDRLRKLREIGELPAAVGDLEALIGPTEPGVTAALTSLASLEGDVDAHVATVSDALVGKLQLDVLQDELPFLARAAVDPATPREAFPAWVQALYPAGSDPGDPVTDAGRLVEAFRACRIADTDSVGAFVQTPEGKSDELAAFLATLAAVRADSQLPARLQRPISVVEADFEHAFTRHLTERLLGHLGIHL